MPADLESFLDEAPGSPEFLAFALAGTRFEPNALERLASCWRAFPKARLAYGDVTIATADECDWPLAFPAFDYERMLEQGYGAYLFAMPVTAASKALEAGADSLFRLFNAPWDAISREPEPDGEATDIATAVHAPGFLARLPPLDRQDGAHRLALATAAHLRGTGSRRRGRSRPGRALAGGASNAAVPRARVSILVPTRDRLDLLQPCLDSLRRTVDLDAHELIVIDNGSSVPATLEYFDALLAEGARVLRAGGPFNFARLIGVGASLASGDLLLLLNNDVEALDEGWLEEMTNRAAEPDIAAVSSTLWPSGVIQHGEIVLGVGFAPAHAFNDRVDGDPGYGDLLAVAHECGAATGACLMTPRRLSRFRRPRWRPFPDQLQRCGLLPAFTRLRLQNCREGAHARLMHRRVGEPWRPACAGRPSSLFRRVAPPTCDMGRGAVEQSLLQPPALARRRAVRLAGLAAATGRPVRHVVFPRRAPRRWGSDISAAVGPNDAFFLGTSVTCGGHFDDTLKIWEVILACRTDALESADGHGYAMRGVYRENCDIALPVLPLSPH